MAFKPKHQKALKMYLKWRDGEFSVIDSIVASWPRYAYLVIVVGGFTILLWTSGQQVLSGIFGGYLLGVLFADTQRLFVDKSFWRVKREVLDWDKVEAMFDREAF